METRTTDTAASHVPPAAFLCWEWHLPDDRFSARGEVAGRGASPASLAELLAWFAPDVRDEVEVVLRRAADDGQSVALQAAGASGGTLLLRAARIADGQLCGVLCDISEQTAQENLLSRDAERARADFDAFAYAVSHDLRAPLRAIGGFSEVLLESEPGTLEDTARQYLPRIVAATRRMSQLLDDLLQLSRFNRAEMHPAAVDLAPMAQQIAERLNTTSGRTAEFIAPAHAPAWGDAKLLEAALQRLLDNAWKFSRNNAAPRIEFGCAIEDGATVCYVRDNGVGFDPDQRGKLFQPLQRLHRANEFEGSGVSLTIVKRIVERHGGTVWADGATDQGASFWFSLPPRPAY